MFTNILKLYALGVIWICVYVCGSGVRCKLTIHTLIHKRTLVSTSLTLIAWGHIHTPGSPLVHTFSKCSNGLEIRSTGFRPESHCRRRPLNIPLDQTRNSSQNTCPGPHYPTEPKFGRKDILTRVLCTHHKSATAANLRVSLSSTVAPVASWSGGMKGCVFSPVAPAHEHPGSIYSIPRKWMTSQTIKPYNVLQNICKQLARVKLFYRALAP